MNTTTAAEREFYDALCKLQDAIDKLRRVIADAREGMTR